MAVVKLDASDPAPLHVQAAAAIRRSIAEGEARPGDRLPPARDIAAVLGVNTNTVLRALRELRAEGLLAFRRGRGVTVVGTPERTAVIDKARELIEIGIANGYRRNDLIQLLRSIP